MSEYENDDGSGYHEFQSGQRNFDRMSISPEPTTSIPQTRPMQTTFAGIIPAYEDGYVAAHTHQYRTDRSVKPQVWGEKIEAAR